MMIGLQSQTSMPPISVEIYTKQEQGYVPLNGLAYKSRSNSSGSKSPAAAVLRNTNGNNRGSQHLGNTSRDSSDDSRKRFLKESKRALQMDTRNLK